MDAVNALGGISLDFPYPVRDHNSATGVNESGLDVTQAGCQVLNGTQALALSRSRYFQYYANGRWNQDPTSDIGRIQRQNLIISAAINRAKSTYNPLRLNALLTSVVHDFSKDDGLTPGDLFGLAERYHAFSGSELRAFTLPTAPADSAVAGSVEIVQPDSAAAVMNQFLGGTGGTITTPPLDAAGRPMPLPVSTTTTVAPVPVTTPSSSARATPATEPPSIPPYDPRPC
jgi:anionic cell wall polymer biosynthesis LytR-Cps2A-Psr (LCP) family protein